MRLPQIIEELPDDYLVEHSAQACFAVQRDVAGELRAAGYGAETDGALTHSPHAGRKPLFALTTANASYLVRRFSHGGLLRALTGARFLDPARPFRELVLSRALTLAGVRTPQVVAARARRAAGGGYRLDLVTRAVADTLDLGHVLALARRGEVGRDVLRQLAAATGCLVARLHAAGCLHADLTPNNILVERAVFSGAAPTLWIIDLDRSRVVVQPSDRERRDNLRRLLRFVARREQRDGKSLARTDFARFMLGYDTQGLRWKEDWRAIEAEHARRNGWHALGWKLERWFGRTPQRDAGFARGVQVGLREPVDPGAGDREP